MTWIETKANGTLNPAQVANTLEQLAGNWPYDAPSLVDLIKDFPLGEEAFLHLISVSSICAARLVRNPETLLWLHRPEICSVPRTQGEMLADLHKLKVDSISAENFRALRFWKGREMVRIALREVAEVA